MQSAVNLGAKLDIKDLAIIDHIIECYKSHDTENKMIGGKLYIKVKAKSIITALPLLGINTERGINKRLNKLKECGLIERCDENKSLHDSYFSISDKLNDYIKSSCI